MLFRSKDVEGLGEAVVVDEARVNGEQPHHEDDVAALKQDVPDLREHKHNSVTAPINGI